MAQVLKRAKPYNNGSQKYQSKLRQWELDFVNIAFIYNKYMNVWNFVVQADISYQKIIHPKKDNIMKIQTIVSQNRRDFQAVYECEHCGNTSQGYGYDDEHFHKNVIPKMECLKCKKTAKEHYRPLTTKYNHNETV